MDAKYMRMYIKGIGKGRHLLSDVGLNLIQSKYKQNTKNIKKIAEWQFHVDSS